MDRRIREQLTEEYRRKREADAAEEARRREELRVSAPRIQSLLDERQEMIGRFCRLALREPAYQIPEAELRQVNARIRAALEQAGYPADWLEPVYQCAKCRDTGFMGEDERKECDCWRQRAFELTATVGRQQESFEAFDEGIFPETLIGQRGITQREQMRKLKQYCENYADRFPAQQPRDLLLYGKSGLGKSYLLRCIAQRLQERGYQAELLSAYEAVQLMREAYYGREDDTARLYECDVLLIDDLGMEPMMENITIQQLFQLINARRSRGKTMVFSTNLDTEEIAGRYSERIASRLFDRTLCRVVELLGQDVRQLQRI